MSAGRRTPRPADIAMAAMLLIPATARSIAAQEPMRPADPARDSAALTDPRAAALDARAADIAARLRCPVCTGQSVLESNSAIAQEMQEVIRERLERGDGIDEILAYFRSAYGDWIVLRPPPTGLNLLVYILPAVAVVGGGLWLLALVRRWSARPSASGSGSDAPGSTRADLSAEDEAWLRRSVGGG